MGIRCACRALDLCFAMAVRYAVCAALLVALASCGLGAAEDEMMPEELVGMWAGIEVATTFGDMKYQETEHPFWGTIEKDSMTMMWNDGNVTEEVTSISEPESAGMTGQMMLVYYETDDSDDKLNVCALWCRVGNVVFWVSNAVEDPDEPTCPELTDEDEMETCGADDALSAIGAFSQVDKDWLEDHGASGANYMFLVEDTSS